MAKFCFLFVLSLMIVGFGQPAWIPFFTYFSAIIGFALFWKSIEPISKKSHRVFIATAWFAVVQCIHLSWMTSTDYQGGYILIVYFFLAIAIALKFGFLTYMIPHNRALTVMEGLFVASLWTLLEWARLYFICGFTWNPVGMAYADHYLPLQMASIWGIYGLSFWVIFGNTLVYRAFFLKKGWCLALLVAFFPYAYGWFHEKGLQHVFKNQKVLSAVLVQTSLLPEQKGGFSSSYAPLPALYQWKRIFIFLNKASQKPIDLIVLPEAVLPNSAFKPFYRLEDVKAIWKDIFRAQSVSFFPPLKHPFARREGGQWFVSNNYIAQALASYYQASLVIGLDDIDPYTGASVNAGFCFENNKFLGRYVKRVLVPLGEYIPFQWCTKLAEKFGIYDSFQAGDEPKVMQAKVPLAISICYEETYSNLIRQSRDIGAKLFVNISNDVWFPSSKLPKQHFDHGRVRAVENGVPLLRACNTGLTGGIDCMGKIVKVLSSDELPSEKIAAALPIRLPLGNYKTIYSKVGDGLIIGICSFIVVLFFKYFRKNRAC